MYQVIIWGTGQCYNRFFNMVKLQELSGAVRVLAVTSNDRDIKDYIDGYPFVTKEEAVSLKFDYCFVAIDDLQAVLPEAVSLGIDRKSVV